MKRAYSSTVTAKRPMKNSLTKTRWTGRSSSSPSPAPMRKSPAGMRARSGAVGSDKGRSIVHRSRPAGVQPNEYSDHYATRTLRYGTDAVHLRESGGFQLVGKRRPPVESRRIARRSGFGTDDSGGAASVHAVERLRTSAHGNRRAVFRRDVRSRAGHQRRLGGELHRDLASRGPRR